MKNLAVALSGLGQHHEAMQIYKKVLAASNQLFGRDDPRLFTARLSLAVSYRATGCGQEAVTLLELSKKVLGERHPQTLDRGSVLSRHYHDLGRFQDAIELQKVVVSESRNALGKENPNTLR